MNEEVPRMPREAQHSEAESRLEALLIEGLSAGEDVPVSPDFWREPKEEATESR